MYIKDGNCKADHASAALNKWLKKDFGGFSSLSQAYLQRSSEGCRVPMDMIDLIGGWMSVSSIGNNYGQGYSMEQVRKCMKLVSLYYDTQTDSQPVAKWILN